jgi:hypothetical protein
MQELVTAGLIGKVPEPPDNADSYLYYNYGSGTIGGLLVTTLEKTTPSNGGVPPSCRPWTGSNWCRSDTPSNQYCICSPQ